MISIIRRNLIDLPTNYSLSYYWSSGFMISAFMIIQILTGVILSFLYVANSLSSFSVVMSISDESMYGWCLRYWHIWGVNVLFFLIFVHMARSLYYSSYVKKGVWNVGFILYLLMMLEAFTGYVLPWHQMSYWATTVLSSVVQSLPVFGGILYEYMVGGFGVTEVTLIRIFSVHVCVGFVILAFMILHMFYLHIKGSNNPLFFYNSFSDLVFFHSYFSVKDFMCFVYGCLFFSFVLLYFPGILLDVESFLEADVMNTPISIKPEWYFLAFFCMLRCVESKLGGLCLVVGFLFFLWIPTVNKASVYCFLRQLTFWLIVSLFLSLTYLGWCHPEYPYLSVCKIFSIVLVAFMFLFKVLWLNEEINGVRL